MVNRQAKPLWRGAVPLITGCSQGTRQASPSASSTPGIFGVAGSQRPGTVLASRPRISYSPGSIHPLHLRVESASYMCGDELRDETELSGQSFRSRSRSGKLQRHRLLRYSMCLPRPSFLRLWFQSRIPGLLYMNRIICYPS